MKTQEQLNGLIQAKIWRIGLKSKNFSVHHKGKTIEDLIYVLAELENIDKFLNDKYLKPINTPRHEDTND